MVNMVYNLSTIKKERGDQKMIELLNKKRELADKIIIEEEWLDIETIQKNAYEIIIKNWRTGREIKLKPYDTEKDIRAIIENSYK